jgi:DnaJ-class molecular chaperone
MQKITYYDILRVQPDDPTALIKARYRLLTLQTHPDHSTAKNGSALFQQYARAYKTLSNVELRTAYNQLLGLPTTVRGLKPGYDLHQQLWITKRSADIGGRFSLAFTRYEPCSLCWGSRCQRCNNEGQRGYSVSISVDLLPGTALPNTIAMTGQGGQLEPGGPRGYLFVYVLDEATITRSQHHGRRHSRTRIRRE